MSTDRTPTERRGYPLPPWSAEARRPSAEELERWLTTLDSDERRAYLAALLERHELAQERASSCVVESHEAELAAWQGRREVLDEQLAEARAAVRDAWRAGYSQRLDDLLGLAGRDADLEPLLVVVPVPRAALRTIDPALVAAVAAELAEVALDNRRAELRDADEDVEELHVCGRSCR